MGNSGAGRQGVEKVPPENQLSLAAERRVNMTFGLCAALASAFVTTCIATLLGFGPTLNLSANVSHADASELPASASASATDSEDGAKSGMSANLKPQSSDTSSSAGDADRSSGSASAGSASASSASASGASSSSTASSASSSASSAGRTSGKWTPVEALESGELDAGAEGGWVETVVHPAVVEHVPAHDSYVCDVCGYETLTLQDMKNHSRDAGHSGYTIVHHDDEDVVVQEEWTEEIYHED